MKTTLRLFFAILILGVSSTTFGDYCGTTYVPPGPPPITPTPCKPCTDAGTGTKPNPCPDQCKASPSYAASGGYTAEAVDVQIPTAGFPLLVARSYESANPTDTGLGLGWSLTASPRLYYATYLFAAPSTYSHEALVALPDGQRLTFTQNGDGSFSAPAHRYDTLVKNVDSSFDLTVRGSAAKYHFGATGRIESMADEFGNAIAFSYDGAERLQRVADQAGSGRYLDFYYGADGRISTIQDHTGRQTAYAYDVRGVLTTVTNAAGKTTNYEYSAVRFGPLLTRIADHWNRTIAAVTYDSKARTQIYTEHGETYTYTYNYNGRFDQSSKTDSSSNRWVTTYDTDGAVTRREIPVSWYQTEITEVIYNADHTIQQSTDEVGVVTKYTYTTLGRVATVTKDFGGAQSVRFDYSYDTTFPTKVASVIPKNPSTGNYDTNWQGWTYDYFQPGSTAPGALWHVYRVRTDGVTTDTIATYAYDAKGRVTSITDAAAGVTDSTYDSVGNLATVTAPTNNDAGLRPVTTYSYDNLGRVTAVTDPLGKVTTYTYDVMDRVATITLPKPSISSTLEFTTTYTYDQYDAASGLLFTHVTDANGNLTKQGYDALGRLAKSIDAATNVTTYTYTRAVLSSITDANGYSTSYQYDGRQRLIQTTFANGLGESYQYYNDGLLKTKTDAERTITFEYDRLKRLTKKTTPAGTINYTYQGQKLTEVNDASVSPNETHTFSYDDRFRVSSNAQATRGTLGYTYDGADRPATMTVTGGPTTTYGYYADGSLRTIEWSPVTGQFKYDYTLRGQYQTITFPNGQTRGYTYDDQARLLQLANTHPTAGNLATYGYAYDLNHATGAWTMKGQRVTMTADVPAQSFTGAVTKYKYDPLYQLIGVEYPNVAPFNAEVHSWTYDAIGNRLTNTVNAVTQNYTYRKLGTNPNNWQRLLRDPSSIYDYTHSDTGNVLSPGASNSFGYDWANRLTETYGTTRASHRYDYMGRRTLKTVTSMTTSYLYEGLNPIRQSASSTTDYLFGPGIDEPLAMSRSGAISYLTADGLGSITTVGNTAGTNQNSYVYDGWGLARTTTETLPQSFRYTAREAGDIADLYFYRARFYSPSVGRFLSEDPVPTFTASYNYVGNDPLSFTDPTGAVKWSKNAPTYTLVDQDTLFYTCGRGSHNAAGCTKFRGSKDPTCKCPCKDGKYNLEISMSMSVQVYVRYNDPRAMVSQIMTEEEKHVGAANSVFDQFVKIGEQYEARPYSSGNECWNACEMFQRRFANAWKAAHKAVDRSHPNL